MKEQIFNLFYFISERNSIIKLGVVSHQISGGDKSKEIFLKNNILNDLSKVKSFPVPQHFKGINSKNKDFTYGTYQAMIRQGRQMELFEDIFKRYNASKNPLFCITAIVNGVPQCDLTINGDEPLYISQHQKHPKLGSGIMSDYLYDYQTPEGIDIPLLLNKDYLEAIKLLYNNQNYVSCMKLLMSFIDTISFLEFGDVQGSFIKWIDTYTNIEHINITSSQLWELRNSILHMSNLDSRKVLNGEVNRISFYIAKKGVILPPENGTTYFNLVDFMNLIMESVENWLHSYNENVNKHTVFIERYDRIISDARPALIE